MPGADLVSQDAAVEEVAASLPQGDKHIKEWADFDVSSEEKQDWRQEKATSSSFAWRDTETGTSCRILEAC